MRTTKCKIYIVAGLLYIVDSILLIDVTVVVQGVCILLIRIVDSCDIVVFVEVSDCTYSLQ